MLVDKLREYEEEETSFEEEVKMFQDLINSGMAWRLQGSYGRRAMDLIRAGYCTLGEEGHTDYYGNYVPSRYEVKSGTMGSPEFVEEHREDDEY